MRPEVQVRDSLSGLAAEGARRFAEMARQAIAERGRFVLSVSGGTTPAPLYDRLGEPWLASRLDWSAVHVVWGDDRWVPHDHADSNVRLVREHWLDRAPTPPGPVHLPPSGQGEPAAAAAAYEATLRAALGGDPVPTFDLHILGMGEDGHTASLFPGSPVLAERTRLVAAPFVPHLDAYRLTLTLPVLDAAREVWVLVVGARKAAMVRRALEESARPIAAETVPIARVRPTSGRLVWLLDQPAAAQLPADQR